MFFAVFRAAAFCAALLALVPPGPAAAQAELKPAEVSFLTLRDRTGSDDPGLYFGDNRSDLKAGRCRVRVVDFGALYPLAQSVPIYLREEFLRVHEVEELPLSQARSVAPDGPFADRRLLYVHGYNLGFDKGCRRAALLQMNAGLEDEMLWFSWPSDGAMTNYTRDESDVYWSVPALAEEILRMEAAGGTPLNVMGHSLGARGLVLALYEVANRHPEARLGHVVLLAPDMDFEIFRGLLPRIRPLADAMTLYIGEDDWPLALSQQVHGYPRLGQTGNDLAQLPGVEVIDVSDLSGDEPTRHLYHIFSDGVGRDLDQLLNSGLRAAERAGLEQVGDSLWRLRP